MSTQPQNNSRWYGPDCRMSSKTPLTNEQLDALRPGAKKKSDVKPANPLTDLIAALENAGLPRPAARLVGQRIAALETALKLLQNPQHLRELEKRS